MLKSTIPLAICLGLATVAANASNKNNYRTEQENALVQSARAYFPQATQVGLEEFALTNAELSEPMVISPHGAFNSATTRSVILL